MGLTLLAEFRTLAIVAKNANCWEKESQKKAKIELQLEKWMKLALFC